MKILKSCILVELLDTLMSYEVEVSVDEFSVAWNSIVFDMRNHPDIITGHRVIDKRYYPYAYCESCCSSFYDLYEYEEYYIQDKTQRTVFGYRVVLVEEEIPESGLVPGIDVY